MSLLPESTDFKPGATLEDMQKEGINTGGKWLPRMQLSTASTNLFKDGKVKNVNTYTLVWNDSKLIELDQEVDVAIFDSRIKALDMRDEVINIYDTKSEQFQEVKKLSEDRDQTGCLCGMEFLLYEPTHKQFCVYFLASWSQKLIIEDVLARMHKWATLCAIQRYSKNQKSNYWAPDIKDCANEDNLERPDPEEAKKQIEEFKNPPDTLSSSEENDSDEDEVDR